jgi:uncharacterized protein YraI
MKRKSWVVGVALAAALPLAASAEQAFTVGTVEVFAGPSSEYPPIAELPPNVPVNVVGCLSDWSWCDVVFPNDRGWVYAGDLVVPYQGNRVVIIEYGPRIHFFPVITFSLVAYWDQHYRSRPFYGERQVWVSRVHLQANRGGRAPSGHEVAVRQGAPSAQAPQAQSAPVQAAKPAERNARATQTERTRTTESERARSAQAEKARTAETQKTQPAPIERSRTAEAARAPKATTPKEAQRPQVAQSPQQPREQHKAVEAQSPRTAQLTERQHQAQPQAQPPRAEPQPQATRPAEAERREAGNAQREEKKDAKAE